MRRALTEEKIRNYLAAILIMLMIMSVFVTGYSFVGKGFSETAYENIWIWPMIFLLFLLMAFWVRTRMAPDHLIVFFLTLITLAERYLVYPFFLSSTGDGFKGVRHYDMDDATVARGILIGAIELLGFAIYIFLSEVRGHKRIAGTQSLRLLGEKNVYLIFGGLSFAVWLLIGRQHHVVQFLRARYSFESVTSSMALTLTKYIVTCGITLAVLMLLAYSKNLYCKTGKNKYFIFALFIAMIQICIISGESRGAQIGVALLMVIMLTSDYPERLLEILIPICLGLVVVIASITLLRTQTTSLGLTSVESSTWKFQTYTGGVDSLAQSVDLFSRKISVSWKNYVFDFARSIFPLNLLLKNKGYTINQIYNLTLYKGAYSHGHIVFGGSYGTILFGYFGAPINICISYKIASYLNERFHSARTYEGKYIAGFCMLRMQAALLSNLPTILGEVTQIVFTLGLIVFVAHMAKTQLRISVLRHAR